MKVWLFLLHRIRSAFSKVKALLFEHYQKKGSGTIIYGLMAEFETPTLLVEAARRTSSAGYQAIEIYTPFPVEGLEKFLGRRRNRLSLLALVGGCIGAISSYFLEYYSAVIDYPINVGGRPYHSWPAFIPATVELTILGAALATVLGLFLFNGLPRLYHPVFNVPQFDLATQDRFFLCVKASDSRFDNIETRRFLESLKPVNVHGVER